MASQFIVQSVVIPKTVMNKSQATQWVKNHYELKKIDETRGAYRFRQYEPKLLKRLGYNRYFTKRLENGIDLVIAVMQANETDYQLPLRGRYALPG